MEINSGHVHRERFNSIKEKDVKNKEVSESNRKESSEVKSLTMGETISKGAKTALFLLGKVWSSNIINIIVPVAVAKIFQGSIRYMIKARTGEKKTKSSHIQTASSEAKLKSEFRSISEKSFQEKSPVVKKETKDKMSEIIDLSSPKTKKEMKLEQKTLENMKNFDSSRLTGKTLQEAVANLCVEHGITPDDLRKEANCFGISEEAALMKMANRLINYEKAGVSSSPSIARRAEETGYEISVVKGIEKVFKHYVTGKVGSSVVPANDRISVIPTKNGMIVEEKQIGEGGFKVAILASNYFEIKNPEDRMQWVTLKPKESAGDDSSQSTHATNVHSAKANVDIENSEEGSGTTVIHNQDEEDTGTSVIHNQDEKDTGTSVIHNQDEEDTGTSVIHNQDEEDTGTSVIHNQDEEVSSVIIHNTNEAKAAEPTKKLKETPELPLTAMRPKKLEKKLIELKKELENAKHEENESIKSQISQIEDLLPKRKSEAEAYHNYESPTENELYEYEIQMTLDLQNIPGVIKTHGFVELTNGSKVMLQDAAGFKLPANDSRQSDITVVDLQNMKSLYTARLKNDPNKPALTDQESIHMMNIFGEAFRTVEAMHERGYIHRDLKEENVLITKEGKAALADFGGCVALNNIAKCEYIGTPRYSAPEAMRCTDSELWNTITEKSDVWSCGMMIQNSLVENQGIANHPAVGGFVNDGNAFAAFHHKMVDTSKFKEGYEASYPEPADKMSLEHLVWSATRFDPEDRPTMTEFCSRYEAIIQQKATQMPLAA